MSIDHCYIKVVIVMFILVLWFPIRETKQVAFYILLKVSMRDNWGKKPRTECILSLIYQSILSLKLPINFLLFFIPLITVWWKTVSHKDRTQKASRYLLEIAQVSHAVHLYCPMCCIQHIEPFLWTAFSCRRYSTKNPHPSHPISLITTQWQISGNNYLAVETFTIASLNKK